MAQAPRLRHTGRASPGQPIPPAALAALCTIGKRRAWRSTRHERERRPRHQKKSS